MTALRIAEKRKRGASFAESSLTPAKVFHEHAARVYNLARRMLSIDADADIEEQPNLQVSKLLGLSMPAVKSRLHRARLLLRHVLAPYFEERAA